ncbi:MAG: aminodeoxychorismate/anthranilate synthase component II [Chitinophagales bacterium]|nr:aminodeoxychorismate/anthranilate synthase component II [Chitinophagales bacterium]MDW8419379.1 aminodeoxychorismate/anthranilate synthase component II [Chitinophagales bacterium]
MVLLLDNYDSFTYNLYHYVLMCGVPCTVIRHDDPVLLDDSHIRFDALLISPGPNTPAEAGSTLQMIERYHRSKPILGVCLGHQAIGQFFGARLMKAARPMHGKTSRITHQHHPLFENIPSPTVVMRYHSLLINDTAPTPLQILATSEEGEVMAIAHQTYPIWGVQFHPESILTTHGFQLIKNWLHLAGCL